MSNREGGKKNMTIETDNKYGERIMGANHKELDKRRPTAIMLKVKEKSIMKGSETRESMGRDKTNAHGERPIGASHDELDTGKTTARRVKGEDNNIQLGGEKRDNMTIDTDK